jgi:cyclopropane fatty-acyl-phospholipid synthase-like methyltransferase
MQNVNDTYFDGHYKEIWKTLIPPELTEKEITFMIPYFKLNAESKVLDMMCGYGRHALGLARAGIPVTAVDNLNHYTAEIENVVISEQIPVTAYNEDILSFTPATDFDLALCMGNSLNFFDRQDTIKLLSKVASSLKQEGNLLINSWSIAEIAWKNFRESSWAWIGRFKYLSESKILFRPTRMESETIIIDPEGKEEAKLAVDYIYSLNEMEQMLEEAGLFLKVAYSIPGKKKFMVGEPRVYIVAGKK